MKSTLLSIIVCATLAVFAADGDKAAQGKRSLADVRGQIGQLIEFPEKIGAVVADLSADDQKALLAELNGAISKMRGTDEEKTVKFVAVNRAFLSSRGATDKTALLAEVFATVPPVALTVVNERFATELFNRAADPARTYSDEEFTNIASKAMETIIARCEKADGSGVRETFAILMFLRASNGTPENLKDVLVSMMPSQEARELAGTEWIRSAMGDGVAKSYDPMLGATDYDDTFDVLMTMRMIGPESIDIMLADLTTRRSPTSPLSRKGMAPSGLIHAGGVDGPLFTEDYGLERIPRTLNRDAAFYPSNKRPVDSNQGNQGNYPYQVP